MARKLAISNDVLFEVKANFTLGNGGTNQFKFNLLAERRDNDTLRKAIFSETLEVRSFLQEIVKGWEGQRLILDDDGATGTPSAFSADAFNDMLDIAGLPALILQAYMKAVQAREKN